MMQPERTAGVQRNLIKQGDLRREVRTDTEVVREKVDLWVKWHEIFTENNEIIKRMDK